MKATSHTTPTATLATLNAALSYTTDQRDFTVSHTYAVGRAGSSYRGTSGSRMHLLYVQTIVADRSATPGLRTFNGRTSRVVTVGDNYGVSAPCNSNGQRTGHALYGNPDAAITDLVTCAKCLRVAERLTTVLTADGPAAVDALAEALSWAGAYAAGLAAEQAYRAAQHAAERAERAQEYAAHRDADATAHGPAAYTRGAAFAGLDGAVNVRAGCALCGQPHPFDGRHCTASEAVALVVGAVGAVAAVVARLYGADVPTPVTGPTLVIWGRTSPGAPTSPAAYREAATVHGYGVNADVAAGLCYWGGVVPPMAQTLALCADRAREWDGITSAMAAAERAEAAA